MLLNRAIPTLVASAVLAGGLALGEASQEDRRAAMKAGASGEKSGGKPEEKGGDKGEGKKSAEKSAEKPAEKPAEKSAEKPAEKPAEPAPPPEPQHTDHYVSHWLTMPSFMATPIPGDSHQQQVESKPGRMLVVVFLASWCEPCQQLMPAIQRLQRRYSRLYTDFVFVFAHDTRDDAQGFMKVYHLEAGFLANHDVLKTFNNPELPSIYIGDRRGWLATRYIKVHAQDLTDLDHFLANQTAY